MNARFRTWLATSLVIGAAALAPAAAAADYEPFLTDFPQGVPPVERYEPFVTDFGKTSLGDQTPTSTRIAPPVAQAPVAAPQGGVDWPSLGIGVAAGIVAGIAGAAVAVGRRHRRTAVA